MPARQTHPASLRPSAGFTAIMPALARGFRYEHPEDLGGFADLDDIFADLMRGRRGEQTGGAETQFRMRGGDVHYVLTVEFLEAVNGAKKRIDMPDGKTLDIAIPAGVQDGQTLRLKGQGVRAWAAARLAMRSSTVTVRPHPVSAATATTSSPCCPLP